MKVVLDKNTIYADDGGRQLDADRPTAIFIHGVLNDHSVWRACADSVAGIGWNTLAIDLPGHGESAGPAPASVGAAARSICKLVQKLALREVALVGHSLGSLIALEVAARMPERGLRRLALLGTAFPMRVSPALLEAAREDPQHGMHLVNLFSHRKPEAGQAPLGPGHPLYDESRRLMEAVLARNPRANLFLAGLEACDAYQNGEHAMAAVRCATLFLLGRHDRMTAPASGRALAAHAKAPTVLEIDAGHAMMQEAPEQVCRILCDFLAGDTRI